MSIIAWVDVDHSHSDDMNRLLDAFRDASTVDELGIGTIRDTFSELLFPGTSTLHQRARYLLFTAWQVSSVASRQLRVDRAVEELRRQEIALIGSLREGEPEGGIIGVRAGAALKRTPSEVYWWGMRRYGIRRCDEGRTQHLRSVAALPVAVADEEDSPSSRHTDPHFVALPPAPDLSSAVTFDLTQDEADFLHERILATCGDTYLAWLLEHRPPAEIEHPWDPELTVGLPKQIAELLEHARRLSYLFLGAPLLYNLLLARAAQWDEGVERFEGRLREWTAEPAVESAAQEWDRDGFWRALSPHWRGNTSARTFVNTWTGLLADDLGNCWSQAAESLIETRERSLKRARSRFRTGIDPEEVAAGFGTGQMTYRWDRARTLINDIRRGRGLDA